jgi:hypothetical protein
MGTHNLRIATVSGNGQTFAALDAEDRLVGSSAEEQNEIEGRFQWFTTMVLDQKGTRLWMTNPTTRELLCLGWPRGNTISRTSLPARATVFRLSPAQDNLIVALENGNFQIREASSGLLRKEIYSGSSGPQALAFSPDGTRLFIGGSNGDLHCFDPVSWDSVHTFSFGDGVEFHRLAFSSDGATLGALTKKGILYVLRTNRS